MTTDLHAAMREAAAEAPFDDFDVRELLDAGARRARRRAARKVGATALVVAVAVAVTAALSDRSSDGPGPANVVHLDLSRAESQELDVLASIRATWRGPMSDLAHDRLLGLTTDGLVLRSRLSRGEDTPRLGLLDPSTGRTSWLPAPPAHVEDVVELTADRLMLFSRRHPRGALLVFDRGSGIWQSSELRLPAGLEVHAPPRLVSGSDGRLYLGSTFEGESGPMGWWTYALPEGGPGQPRPELTGAAVAWGDGVQATADTDGRVVVSTAGSERLVADDRPVGCAPPSDPDLALTTVFVGLAGDRPVATYWCDGAPGDDALVLVTVVYSGDGREAVQISGAGFRAADEDHVLLTAPSGGRGGTYLLDLDRLTLARIGPALHDAQVGLTDGLVLWNHPGPIDDDDVYDVVWKVARLPLDD